MQSSSSTSHFLRLPLEIRDLIYENLLVAHNRDVLTRPVPIAGHSNAHKINLFPAIVRVNRQINVEAARILYGQNVFGFTVQGRKEIRTVERCGNDLCVHRRHPCWVHPRNLSLIRHIQIDVYSYYDEGQDFTTFNNIAKICRVFTCLPPLKTLVVRYQMLLGATEVIETPDDAHLIAKYLRKINNYEQSDHARELFKSEREGAYDKSLLALTLLRTIRSVTIQPLPSMSIFGTPVEVYFLQFLESSPRLSKGYTRFLQDKILQPFPGYKEASREDDNDAYDSGVEL